MAKAYNRDSGGDGGSAALRDIYLRHGINITRYSNHEARKLQGILDAANVQIRGIISKAKGIETKEKYRRIAAEIRRISRELSRQLNGQVQSDFTKLAEEEAKFVENAVRSVGLKTGFELPAPAKIWAAASFGSYSENGHETFETYLDGLGDNLYKTWDSQVRAGYLAGLTAKQINRNVLGSVKDLEPGQMQTLRRSLERNTRTMVASMAEMARDETYRKNSRLFSGYRYLGTLDSRTCLACGELDGKKFETLEEAPALPSHHNCRCLYLPCVKGMEDFDDGDERASVDGPVSVNTTYDDWLKTQPDDVVRDILGPTRFEMYKSGIEINTFVTDGRTLTLKELADKEGIDLANSKEQVNNTDTTVINRIKNITGIQDISLTGIKNEVQDGILEAFDDALEKYPSLRNQFVSLKDDSNDDGYASIFSDQGAISLNKNYYRDLPTIEVAYADDIDKGFHPEGTDWRATIIHEIGHRLNTILNERYANKLITYGSNFGIETLILEDAFDNLSIRRWDIAAELSGYATKNDREFFAEAFSEYVNRGVEARRLAKEVGSMIELAVNGNYFADR